MLLDNGFWVLKFKNPSHSEDAPSHYHITIVCDCKAICIPITSDVNKRKVFYERSNPVARGCLVEVTPGDFSFLRYSSVIDCNQPNVINLAEAKFYYDVVINRKDFPEKIRRMILKAILKSPLVNLRIKNMLKNYFFEGAEEEHFST